MDRCCQRIVFAVLLSISSECASAITEPQAVQIPLDQIWAYKMPGTKDVRELDGIRRNGVIRHPLIEPIRASLAAANRPKKGEPAGTAFLVPGEDEDALKYTAAVFEDKLKPLSVVAPGTDSSLVFFSYSAGRYVRLVSVERTTNKIIVNYQFVSHLTQEMSSHFALIPLGELLEGSYQVEIRQAPPTTNYGGRPGPAIPAPESIVCNAFSFHVGQ